MQNKSVVLSLALMVSSMQIGAEPIVKEIIGDEPPYFFGYVTDDLAHGWHTVKKEARELHEECFEDTCAFIKWVKSHSDKAGWLTQSGYQLLKMWIGVNLCTHPRCELPAGWFGMEQQGDGSVLVKTYDEDGNHDDYEPAPGWRKGGMHLLKVPGIYLIYHGLKGLVRQCGFDTFGELYSFMENQKEETRKVRTIKRRR